MISLQEPTSIKRRRRRPWEKAFLETLARTGIVLVAAQAAGIDRPTTYVHRERHPDFAVAWDEAMEQATDLLEAEAVRRARDGIEKPVTVAGCREVIREYSDALLIFLLKHRRPQIFKPPAIPVELTGKDGGPIEHLIIALTEEERREAVVVLLEHGLLPSPHEPDTEPEPLGPDPADR